MRGERENNKPNSSIKAQRIDVKKTGRENDKTKIRECLTHLSIIVLQNNEKRSSI